MPGVPKVLYDNEGNLVACMYGGRLNEKQSRGHRFDVIEGVELHLFRDGHNARIVHDAS